MDVKLIALQKKLNKSLRHLSFVRIMTPKKEHLLVLVKKKRGIFRILSLSLEVWGFLRLRFQFSKNFEVFWGWGLNFFWGFLRFYPRKTSKFEVRLRAAVLRLRVKFWGFFEVFNLRFFWGFSRKPWNTSKFQWLTIYRWNKFPRGLLLLLFSLSNRTKPKVQNHANFFSHAKLGAIHKWRHPRGGTKNGNLGWFLRHNWGDKGGEGVKKLEKWGDVICGWPLCHNIQLQTIEKI